MKLQQHYRCPGKSRRIPRGETLGWLLRQQRSLTRTTLTLTEPTRVTVANSNLVALQKLLIRATRPTPVSLHLPPNYTKNTARDSSSIDQTQRSGTLSSLWQISVERDCHRWRTLACETCLGLKEI